MVLGGFVGGFGSFWVVPYFSNYVRIKGNAALYFHVYLLALKSAQSNWFKAVQLNKKYLHFKGIIM